MTLRGYLGLAILATSALLAAGLAYQSGQASKYRKLDEAHRACVASIGPKARADADPSKLCPGVVAVHWAVSVRSQACDQALAAKPENAFGIKASCSTTVKAVWAARSAAQTNLTNTQAELAEERAGRKAALARAAADATAQAERKTRRASIDQTAPRDPDGRVVCDAQCLRDRFRR